jgi:hypothetical protein
LIALNLARSTEEGEVAQLLEKALEIAEVKRARWLEKNQDRLTA